MSIGIALARLEEEISRACSAAGRDRSELTLIAVTKTVPTSRVREAYQAGIRHVGENRVQEILGKRPDLADLGLSWHMIGHLQSNKVKTLLPEVSMIHTLDRFELAERIGHYTPPNGLMRVLIQVNTTGEATKSGVAPEGAEALFEQTLNAPFFEVQGLMTIGPLDGTEAEIRSSFARLRALRDRLSSRFGKSLPVLSMGMSDDFPWAIQEGATHLRIGSRIFGPRV